MKVVVSPLKSLADHNSNVVQNIGLINKLKHCGIRTKANYLYSDFEGLTPKYCGKCRPVSNIRTIKVLLYSFLLD